MHGLLLAMGMVLVGQGDEVVGERPYEMVWAGRDKDEYPVLIDFEDLDGWAVRAEQAVARVERSREQQMYGEYVAKVTYRADGAPPRVFVEPPAPVPCPTPFDTVTLWVYGNNWAWIRDATTPQVNIIAHFVAADGTDVPVLLYRVNAKYWFLVYRKLTPQQQERLRGGASFTGFEITGGSNKEDRSIYLDSLAVFTEELKPLTFEPRPERGIPMFPGQTTGTNTGPGKLPFPTRPETILPTNLTDKFKTTLAVDGDSFVFTYDGEDGRLTCRITPQRGMFDDITARWEGRGGDIRPCVGGGVYFAAESGVRAPESAEHLSTAIVDDTVVSRWRLAAGEDSTEVSYTYHLWQKSLVIDVKAPGGAVGEVRYGRAVGLENPRLTQIPYLANSAGRAHAVISGDADRPLFLMSHTDWYLSNASILFGAGSVEKNGVVYNGGTRYLPKTDGQRNDVYERLFVTLSPRFEEVLPTVANPISPWKQVTGKGVWRAHGAGNRDDDAAHWRQAHRYGMRHLIITDHETGWRDEGESFTFRTYPAPKKGGDEGQYRYARVMQDELGFVYGPYNNYTDFAPVNEYWSADLINRLPDGQLQRAWARCYAPKPSRAVEYCARLAPRIQEKFQFSTAYCDVHTAVTPWSRTDYDARVPGAGTFAATFYAYGEIMLHQKKAWNGPVYSEGNHHCYLHGLTDGNYAQDQAARLPVNPWLVDFDLLKLHDLGCNFGMGNPGMFYGRNYPPGRTREEADFITDRFLAATIAFGHPGFLVYEGGLHNALRSYYMVQQLASSYTQASVASIRYADADGKLYETSAALANDVFRRSQLVNTYANGCVTVVNGHPTERMKIEVGGRQLDLPPAGYAGWTADGAVEVYAGDVDGHRIDYAVTPEYVYIDGRGKFTRMPRAAGDGIGICRAVGDGTYEVIPYREAASGFDIGGGATAVALDANRQEIGPAEVRVSRGLAFVMPVEGAFSYILTPADAPAVALTADRDVVVAGEKVTVRGQTAHEAPIPADLKPGDRYWHQEEGAWIDFTIAPLADTAMRLVGNSLDLTMTSHVPRATPGSVTLLGGDRKLTFDPEAPARLQWDLGEPEEEGIESLTLTMRAGELAAERTWVLRTVRGKRELAAVPKVYTVGMRLRGAEETGDVGQTRAHAHDDRSMSCGGSTRQGIFMHPPYVGGVGYTFALLEAVELPPTPAAAFRCSVGKRDGSDPGDGILFKVAVVDEQGVETELASQVVTEHEWLPLEADLEPWAGQTIRIKLISDVGEADNSSGDWACWADFRIETRDQVLTRSLEDDSAGEYRTVPGPYPIEGLTQTDLRAARRGWLRYDGIGLSGTGQYATYAVVNDVELGEMAPAGGAERQGVWAEKVGVELTADCLATLAGRNLFRLLNPHQDWFKVRRFWIELELADGRKCSSRISTVVYTQPPNWPYFEGVGVPHGEDITVDIWFDLTGD